MSTPTDARRELQLAICRAFDVPPHVVLDWVKRPTGLRAARWAQKWTYWAQKWTYWAQKWTYWAQKWTYRLYEMADELVYRMERKTLR